MVTNDVHSVPYVTKVLHSEEDGTKGGITDSVNARDKLKKLDAYATSKK